MNRYSIGVGAALLLCLQTHVSADQVFLDDLIVSGSACVGSGCVNNEDFGFDTLRLKGDDPLLRFTDTSTGTFPTQDWAMGITNDSAGAPQFFIREGDSGIPVLLLESYDGGGVAIGRGATLEPGAVSVGDTGTERKIMHVADGVDPTDVATLGQMDAQVQLIGTDIAARMASDRTEVDGEISALQAELDALTTRLNTLEAGLGI